MPLGLSPDQRRPAEGEKRDAQVAEVCPAFADPLRAELIQCAAELSLQSSGQHWDAR